MNLVQENLIEALGIESLSDDKKIEIVEKASELIQKRLMIRIFESLPKEKQDGLGKLLDDNDQVGVSNFFHHNVPDYEKWVTEEIVTVRSQLSGLAKSA